MPEAVTSQFGFGVDRVYSAEHDKLYQRIIENGAVISEFPIGTRPLAFNFPARNRLISGLSLGAVVVEATEKSGSLITAAMALEQGREVFAVPGEVGASRIRVPHRLIRQGAKLVETVDDIIEEIGTAAAGAWRQSGERAAAYASAKLDVDFRKIFALFEDRSFQMMTSSRVVGIPLRGFPKSCWNWNCRDILNCPPEKSTPWSGTI